MTSRTQSKAERRRDITDADLKKQDDRVRPMILLSLTDCPSACNRGKISKGGV
jgi:hypothetical protein